MYHKNIPYRRQAQAKYKKKLERISNKMCYSPSGAYKVEKDGKSYYRRYYRPKFSKYLKKLSAKANRRRVDDSPRERSYYRKVFDYWWELY